MSQNTLIVGLQWGDEGKGKLVDALTGHYEVVARFQGGANAGHTVHIGDEKFVLHLVPSGILHKGKLCVTGNGVVVDPEALGEEIQELRDRGIQVGDNLCVSDRAHMVLPYHKSLDEMSENERGEARIGTTGRGIGPCYADKAARCGLRLGELLRPDSLREKLERVLKIKNLLLTRIYGAEPYELDVVYGQCLDYAEKLRPFVKDTVSILHKAVAEDRPILLEGAQGTMLDINFGTYPYVTSSSVVAGGAAVGTGIPPKRIDNVVGVVKAYCSRVGEGPFVTEQSGPVGEHIRERGNEYGATTGRPRRCGWLDGVALRYAASVNGVDSVAVMLLDVLSDFEKLKICVAYQKDGIEFTDFPAHVETLQEMKPLYRELPGWQCDISDARSWQQLPTRAQNYLDAIAEIADVKVSIVSVGPGRSQLITRDSHGYTPK